MNLGSESETVEFKKSTGEHKEALQAVSAMFDKHTTVRSTSAPETTAP